MEYYNIDLENKPRQRHGFITFWLWFCIVVSSISTPIALIGTFQTFASSYSPSLLLLFTVFSLVQCVVHLTGCVLLLRWYKMGFNFVCISYILGFIASLFFLGIGGVQTVISTLGGSIVGIVIWIRILKIKKNGVPFKAHLKEGFCYKENQYVYLAALLVAVVAILVSLLSLHGSNGNKTTDEEATDNEEIFYDSVAVDTFIDETIADRATAAPQPKKRSPTAAQKSQEKAKPIKNETNDDDEDYEMMKGIAATANAQTPMDAGNGVTITRIYISGKYFMYDCECDPDVIDFDQLKQNKYVMKGVIKDEFKNSSDEDTRTLVRVLKNAKYGIGYKYINPVDRSSFTIYIPYHEL